MDFLMYCCCKKKKKKKEINNKLRTNPRKLEDLQKEV